MYDLSGEIAMATGAAGRRGICRAIATRLASESANVAVSDMSPQIGTIRADERAVGCGGLESVAFEIEDMGRESLALFADVSDSAQVDDLVGRTLAKFGRIDILVNNAASRPGRRRVPIVGLEEESFDEVMRVNVRGTYLVSLAVARHMTVRGAGGKIINMSSVMGKRGVALFATYSASKFAIISFTQEMAQHRVNVNEICPRLVDTERVDFASSAQAPEGMSTEERRAMLVAESAIRTPMGHIAQTDDIARMAAILGSSEENYITGLSISVSGGLEMN